MKNTERPHIICHMVMSIDGKVTGDFLTLSECERATEIYYEINRDYKSCGSGGFICGRVTMEDSFTGGWYPELSDYIPTERKDGRFENYFSDTLTGYYAIAFDPRGKLGWKEAFIEDYDPGYDKAQIIEVLTEQADPRYLTYLREKGISYLFAGENEIDPSLALSIISERLAPGFLLLEGGSIINGYFLCADCIDELSLVVAPVVADRDAKPLFTDAISHTFILSGIKEKDGTLVMNYKRCVSN